MNKDNQIMSLLSDIDEEFIDDILEIPQMPENYNEIAKASGKGMFLKFAAPIAACLAVVGAAVGVLAALNKNVDVPASPIPEQVSDEEIEDCLNYLKISKQEFTPHVLDLDFDGSYEVCCFPKNCTQSSIYIFSKEDGSYSKCEAIDNSFEGHVYYLYDFEDIKLYDKDGEKYYYYHYYDHHNEEKGIAAFVSPYRTRSLLSYGCNNPREMNSLTEVGYCKKGDEYIDFEEFQRLWDKYEEAPAIKFEEYWASEEVTLDGAVKLSDVLDNLTYIPDLISLRPDHLYDDAGEKVILSQIDCGADYKVTVLGYRVVRLQMFGREFITSCNNQLVLSDGSGKVLDSEEFNSPQSWQDGRYFDIPLEAVDSCMDVIDFGDNQVIMLRGSISAVCEDTLLWGVKNGAFCGVARTYVPERDYDYISGAYSIEGLDTENPVLVDPVSKNKYIFDFSNKDMIVYSIIYRDTLPENGGDIVNIGEYVPVKEEEIPFIDLADLDFKEKAQAVLQNSLPKVLFKQKSVAAGQSVYNFYLIAENVRRSIEGMHSNEYIYCNNVRTAIFKDGIYLGSVNGIYNYYYANSPFPLGTDFDKYIAKGYYCQEYDTMLIVKSDPSDFSNYAQQCFAAVKNGKLYPNLGGSWQDINPKPEGLESSDEIEVNGNELSCGYYVYRFNFDDSGFGMGQYDFEVYWRDEGAE